VESKKKHAIFGVVDDENQLLEMPAVGLQVWMTKPAFPTPRNKAQHWR